MKNRKKLISIIYKFALIALLFISIAFFDIIDKTSVLALPTLDISTNMGTLDGGLGSSRAKISLDIAEAHKEEVKNFTAVTDYANRSEGFIQGYSYISKGVYQKPETDSDYNDIDTVLYMIIQLEKLALQYTNNDRQKANNCVLGYIRGINKSYGGSFTVNECGNWIMWADVCGTIDEKFIAYVKENEGAGIRYIEFFASFLQNADKYNIDMYGAIDDSYLSKNFTVPDPLGSGQSIDLIHMFAAMDGIYKNTERFCGDDTTLDLLLLLGSDHLQRDLISWLGDLHQLTSDLQVFYKEYKNLNGFVDYDKNLGHIDFNEFVKGNSTKFSSADLLADLDAFNIVKFFVDDGYNSLSSALKGYYTTMRHDSSIKGNRYYEFIYTSTLEPEQNSKTLELKFRNEVCYLMNLAYVNGEYKDNDRYDTNSMVFHFMNEEEYPAFEVRKYCAKLFCDYIISMSHRFG